MIAIEKMNVGTAPAEFEFGRTGQGGPGQWVVVAEPTASSGRAIEQSSTDQTDYRFPLAIYKPLSAKNADASVRFKAVAGTVDRVGGRQQIEGADTKVSANEWHTLGLKVEGGRFTITFDGKTLFTASDRAMTGAGKVVLWTKADSVTRFERIEIKTLP